MQDKLSEKVVTLYGQHESMRAVGRALRISQGKVRRILLQAGIDIKDHGERVSWAAEAYDLWRNKGFSLAKIKKTLGLSVSRQRIHQVVIREGSEGGQG